MTLVLPFSSVPSASMKIYHTRKGSHFGWKPQRTLKFAFSHANHLKIFSFHIDSFESEL